MTDAELVVNNILLLLGGPVVPSLKAILLRQTSVILGDEAATDQEIDAALAKQARIAAHAAGEGVTLPGGEVMTPFDTVCAESNSGLN